MEEAKEVDNNAQVARKHGISEASVRCWRKNEEKLISKKCFPMYNSRLLAFVLYTIYTIV